MSVTINDIARALKLSKATVSKALNGYGDVSVDTRELVLQTAHQLGYQPSAIARSLSLGRTQNIALLLNASVEYVLDYLTGVLPAAVQRAHEYDKRLILHPTPNNNPELLITICRAGEYDGVILFSAEYPDSLFDALVGQKLPFVVLGERIHDPRVSYIAPDYYDGSYQATRHLITLGHQRIAMMSRPDIKTTNTERLQGYHDALRDAGIKADPALVYETRLQPHSGVQAAHYFLQLPDRPTAIFAFHDLLAVETLHVIQQAGLRVPDDIALVGFDGLRSSQMTLPPLTTVQQPFEAIGVRVIDLMLEQIQNPATRAQEIVPVELVIRASTHG